MIKHIVIWKLKDKDKAKNIKIIKQRLEALAGHVPGMIKIEVGADFSHTQSSGDVVLYSEFKNRQALDEYQVHPEHESVKEFIMEVREQRWIVDYEV